MRRVLSAPAMEAWRRPSPIWLASTPVTVRVVPSRKVTTTVTDVSEPSPT